MILKLKIKIILSENIAEQFGISQRTVKVSGNNIRRYPPAQASRKRNKSVRIPAEQVYVNTRLRIKAFGKGKRYHMAQIAVASFIFNKQNQMIARTVYRVFTVKTGPSRNVYFAAYYRLDSALAAGTVK